MRIVAVVFIVIYHVVENGILYNNEHLVGYLVYSEGSFTNRVFASCLLTLGSIANCMFFMLPGYFLVFSTPKFSKVMRLYFQVLFYGLFTTLIVLLVKKTGYYTFPEWVTLFQKTQFLVIDIIPITSGGVVTCGGWWFTTTYMVLYLFSPAINFFLGKMNKRIHKTFLVVFLIFWVCPCIAGYAYSNLQLAVFCYCVGAYIRLYHANGSFDKNRHFPQLVFLAIAILSLLANFFVEFQYDRFEVLKIMKTKFNLTAAIENSYKLIILLIKLVSATSIFLFFKATKIPHNNIINKVASCSFGVYLLHASPPVILFIWQHPFDVLGNYKLDRFPVIAFLIMLAIYGAGIIVDLFRQRFFAPITDGITEHIIRHYKAIRSEGQDKPQECSSTH